MSYGNPTKVQIDAVNAAPDAKQGDVRTNRGQDGYIFASGILKPEHSDFLSHQYPQYLGTAILERIGRYEGIAQSEWAWSEMGRTRSGAVITAGAGNGASLTLTTDFSVVGDSDGYFIVGDTIRTESGVQAKVDGVGVAGGFQTITVSRVDGTNFVAGDIANTENVGHIGNVFGEYSDAPKGRLYLPNARRNQLQIKRRTCNISGSAMTDRTYLKEGSWAYAQELIDMDEFARDRENTVMFEELSAPGADKQTTEGIVTAVHRGGIISNYTGSVTEADIQDHISALRISSPAKEYMVFCGMEFLNDAHKALRDYHIGGGINYGAFSKSNMVGITLKGYDYMDCTIYFVHYPTFDDTETLPYDGTATADKINFSNYSLWLNLGSERGKKLISLKYKELNGKQRKFIYKPEEGIMGDGATASNGKDGTSTHMLSEIGVEVRNLNQHGALYANA